MNVKELKSLRSKLKGLKWVALDIETTHLDHYVGDILQFYAVGYDGKELELFFKPLRMHNASEYSLKINKYEDFKEIYQNSKDFLEHAYEINDFLGNYNTVIGKNVHFDMNWLNAHLSPKISKLNLPYRHFDLTSVAIDKLSGTLKYFGMDKVVSAVLGEEVTHGARSDVEQTLRCLDILLDESSLVKFYLFVNKMFLKYIKKVDWIK